MSKIRDSYNIAREMGMGRIAYTDPRSYLYRMNDWVRPKVQGESRPSRTNHKPGKTLNQFSEGTCVGHGVTDWENCTPKGHKRQQGHAFALKIYDRATELDPFPNNDGDRQSGTTVAAGFKAARELGLCEAWVNATDSESVYNFLWQEGPVVVGMAWKESMDRMTDNYFLNVDLSSRTRGGHCWAITNYLEEDVLECQNSWGEGYGDEGFFYLTRVNFEKLLYAHGEALGAIQTGVPPR